eukprot:4771146-Amphidinium_carterae.1
MTCKIDVAQGCDCMMPHMLPAAQYIAALPHPNWQLRPATLVTQVLACTPSQRDGWPFPRKTIDTGQSWKKSKCFQLIPRAIAQVHGNAYPKPQDSDKNSAKNGLEYVHTVDRVSSESKLTTVASNLFKALKTVQRRSLTVSATSGHCS